MATTKFIITDRGDESVGIFPINAEVTITDNFNHDKEYIDHLKESLQVMYEDSNGLVIFTEAENTEFEEWIHSMMR